MMIWLQLSQDQRISVVLIGKGEGAQCGSFLWMDHLQSWRCGRMERKHIRDIMSSRGKESTILGSLLPKCKDQREEKTNGKSNRHDPHIS